jgi:hypothetical protein
MKPFGFFLFLALCIVFDAHSQQRPLQSFTNYGSCYQGLKSSKNGRIVWKAEFESLFEIWDYDSEVYPRKYFWKAEKNGSFGLLDPEGEIVLPFEYSKITPIKAGFVAAKGGDSFLFTNTGELLLEFKSYDWFIPFEKGYIVKDDEKFGFLDLELNEVLPAIYDKMHFAQIRYRSEGVKEVFSNRFLTINLNEQTSVYDLQVEKFVIPFTSDYVHLDWVSECASSDLVIQTSQRNADSIRVFNSNGDEVLRTTHSSHVWYELTPLDSCGEQSIQLAYLESDRKMKVFNVKSERYSNEHREIYPMNGYSIYFDENKWGVIYPDFNESKPFSYPKYEMHTYEGIENARKISLASERFNLLFERTWKHDKIDSVLITTTTIKKSRKNEFEDEQFGLINFRTGKKIKTKYSRIRKAKYDGRYYYWAIEQAPKEPNSYSRPILGLDIYDSELTLVREFDDTVDIRFRSHYEQAKHQIVKYRNKMGLINARGEDIVPIKFDACGIREVYSYSKRAKLKELIVTTDESSVRMAVYDYDGNLLISKKYEKMNFLNEFIFASNKGRTADCYNIEGELLIADVESYGFLPFVNEFGNCFDEVDEYHKERPKCIYAVKQNVIYAFVDRSFLRLDENYFKFEENYCYLHHRWLIDQNGKIVTLEPEGIIPRPELYIRSYERLKECSTFLDEYPVPLKQTRKTPEKRPPPANREKPKSYQWKKNPTNKGWFLYDPDGNLTYSQAFDFPTIVGTGYPRVFGQNGKYGFFNGDFQIELEAEFDYLYRNGSFGKKHDQWFIRKGNSNQWSDGFSVISTQKVNGLRFVFNDGEIGLIDDSLNFVIPMTDSLSFLSKYDLVKTLNLRGRYNKKQRHEVDDIIFNATPATVYRQINNVHIVEDAYFHSTAHEKLEFSPVDAKHSDITWELAQLKLQANEDQLFRERVPSYFNKYFYSEITYTRNTPYYGTYSSGNRYADKELFNYKIVNNELIPIQLSDILKTDEQSIETLNKMILKKLTNIQAYGDNCTDINSKVEALKANFLIRGSSIILFSEVRGAFQIELYFSELEKLFKYPNKMLVRY